MPLVQVDERGFDSHGSQGAHPPDPEQSVLSQAELPVADVQPSGNPSIGRMIARVVGVEQKESGSTDVDPPDLRKDSTAPQRDTNLEGFAVSALYSNCRKAIEQQVRPVLVLPAPRVEALVKVALLVEQTDGDQR
jgi:hypothetical protein